MFRSTFFFKWGIERSEWCRSHTQNPYLKLIFELDHKYVIKGHKRVDSQK